MSDSAEGKVYGKGVSRLAAKRWNKLGPVLEWTTMALIMLYM